MRAKYQLAVFCVALAIWGNGSPETSQAGWANGPSTNQDYFPIGVWLQRPDDAARWRAAGVNLYSGLWQGPTTSQLDTLRAAGMQAVVAQNSTSLQYTNRLSDGRPVIVGWLLDDEPDNAQPNGSGGYGPPVPTATVQQTYLQIKSNDPTRPIILNLGQGLGWDNATWYGQGGHINPAVDYPQYILGSDIVSFDIYPMTSSDNAVAGDAWRVALGVDRLRQYAPSNHLIWCFIETGDISGGGKQATIAQIRAEVWMALIHGATGINYFIHGKTSVANFDDRALLRPENAARLAGVTTINHEVHSLASALNSSSVTGLVSLTNVSDASPVDFMVKQRDGTTYLFAVGMRDVITTKGFRFQNFAAGNLEVIGEDRKVAVTNGFFTDAFHGYEAHLYRTLGTNRLSLSLEPPNATLSWNSTSGLAYTVQYKSNLNQPLWLFLGKADATSANTTFTDTALAEPQRFYRVVGP